MDDIDRRKLQREPVPVMGGIAIFFGLVAGLLFYLAFIPQLENNLALAALLCGMVLMLYMGALDDALQLSAASRALVETLAVAALMMVGGVWIDQLGGALGVERFSAWFYVPLTLLSGVGIINSINMIDGVNGLSSGMCLASSCIFGIVFLANGQLTNAALAICMASSLLPFLLHNVFGKTSRMFIGDGGTMVMGLMTCWFAFSLIHHDEDSGFLSDITRINRVALALAILSVPVFDTLRVMTMRVLRGVSPFKPDKTHLHHMFVIVGMSHSFTALSEIVIDLLIVLGWYVSILMGAGADLQLIVVVGLSLLLVWGVYGFLFYNAKHDTFLRRRIEKFGTFTHQGHSHWWIKLQQRLDAEEELK